MFDLQGRNGLSEPQYGEIRVLKKHLQKDFRRLSAFRGRWQDGCEGLLGDAPNRFVLASLEFGTRRAFSPALVSPRSQRDVQCERTTMRCLR